MWLRIDKIVKFSFKNGLAVALMEYNVDLWKNGRICRISAAAVVLFPFLHSFIPFRATAIPNFRALIICLSLYKTHTFTKNCKSYHSLYLGWMFVHERIPGAFIECLAQSSQAQTQYGTGNLYFISVYNTALIELLKKRIVWFRQ